LGARTKAFESGGGLATAGSRSHSELCYLKDIA
jgi:hypothetical protein